MNLLKCALCQDGTFLVRDSSNRSSNQPYTLVVLYQDKVFNIQIRRFQDGFLLGTGLKSSEVLKHVFFYVLLIITTCILTNVCNTIVFVRLLSGSATLSISTNTRHSFLLILRTEKQANRTSVLWSIQLDIKPLFYMRLT